MLTRPELDSKQILTIVVEPGRESRLRLSNKNIVYEKDGEIINKCSLSRLLHIMIIGDISITTNLIRELNEQGVSVSLLKNNLTPYAYFGFETQANFMLRSQQYSMSSELSHCVAKSIVADKIHNQAVLLRRIGGDPPGFSKYSLKVLSAQDLQSLLGVEGSASKHFFREYYHAYGWKRRSPRTKEDSLNFMLDIGYTTLFNFTDAVCRHFGFDTYKGVYHTQFFARRSLVCDLMEPFRCLIDNRTRTALSLKIVNPEMFHKSRYGIYTDWKDTTKISRLYAQEVMDNRLLIFEYVSSFYKYIMHQQGELPSFRLKR